MISFNSQAVEGEIGALMARYAELPRHIAKKHLGAAMRKVIKPGVPILRRNTPPLGQRRGRRKKGEKSRSSGALRRAVAVRVGTKGTKGSSGAFAYGVLGYKKSFESRKAIWLQFGTSGGVRAFRMIEKTIQEFGPVAADKLAAEMAAALERASAELSSGKNPGYGG